MLYVIFSDIHGNTDKFNRMLAAADAIPARKRFVCLGDITGGLYHSVQMLYDELRYNDYTTVKGNCDDGFDFTDGPITVDNTFIACHGSPYRVNDYIRSVDDAKRVFAYLSGENVRLLFYGHTHRSCLYECDRKKNITERYDIPTGHKVMLNRTSMYLCNPGTLGKPKAATPFCSFAIYDSQEHSLEWRRV